MSLWDTKLETVDLDLTDEEAEAERRPFALLSDRELLDHLFAAASEATDLANPLLPLAVVVPEADWEIPELVPVQLRLQICLIWHSAAEALGISSAAFYKRASHTALAQIRLILDAYCLVRWLTEFEDRLTRRALGLALRELDDAMRLERHMPNDGDRRATNIKQLEWFRDELSREASEHGDDPERPPSQQDQYARWLGTYGLYALASEVGSHIGFRYLPEFFRDEGGPSHKYKFDFIEGGLKPRAFYLSAGYITFVNLSEVVAAYFGWDEMAADIRNHFARHRGACVEAQARINSYWLGTTRNEEG